MPMSKLRSSGLLVPVLGLLAVSVVGGEPLADFPKLSASQDWPWWRGPSRDGHAGNQAVPTELGPTTHVIWKAAVPGRGHSSPTVVGDSVFLTTADEATQTHSILAFSRRTGDLLWRRDVNQGGFPERNHPKNTEATPTVASDGERLFAAFHYHGRVELLACDSAGKILWRETVGPFDPRRYQYGYGPSPVLYKNTVIIATEFDGPSALTALDRATGKRVWQTERPENMTYSTPMIATVAGREQLLLSGAQLIVAYDPATGAELWQTPGTTHATCGTMVVDGDLAFASGGYPKAETIAVRADGTGTVAWRNRVKCYEQSMIVIAGYVYALSDNGIFYCWRGADGQEMWHERLTGPVSASPVYAGGHLYWANEKGTLYVLRPNPTRYDLVAENQIGTESFASPAVAGGQLFLRVANMVEGKWQETLYCFGAN